MITIGMASLALDSSHMTHICVLSVEGNNQETRPGIDQSIILRVEVWDEMSGVAVEEVNFHCNLSFNSCKVR